MIKILQGNCLDKLKELPDQSINTCITSPPYWGLRNYNDEEKQLGMEDTPEEYVNNLVEVFREVKRVLRDCGNVWLNLGDSYAMSSIRGGNKKFSGNVGSHNHYEKSIKKGKRKIPNGLKPKDLIGIPFRVAFALQQDGWYLRQDIIWHKPNPMPESIKDRCTKAHEYIFLLSKSSKYYFDNESIKEDCVGKDERKWSDTYENSGSIIQGNTNKQIKRTKRYSKDNNLKRNKRSVWTVTTKPFKGAHFATFPMDLIEPCVLAGCPEKVCVACGTPYKKEIVVEKNLTKEQADEIKANLIKTNKEKKPYAIIDKEFRNQVIEYRNLPKHDDLRNYLKEFRIKSNYTIDEIEQHFGTQAPHHWFEKNGSYPSKEDWLVLKPLLKLDDTYDAAMTEIFYKSGLKGSNSYIEGDWQKQCNCETNETKPGTVLDPFGGSGTTGIVASNHNRKAILIELNAEYIEIARQRIQDQGGLFTDLEIIDG